MAEPPNKLLPWTNCSWKRCLSELQIFWHELNCPRNGRVRESWGNAPEKRNSFDREFPESARILMLKGAELILAPNACPMEINRLSALRTRAYENMVAVATCNYSEGHPDCNGRSTLFDGVPWLRNEPGSRDMCVFEAPESAGVYVADLNLDKLRAHRSQDIMGDKYRHPHKYGILADENVRDVIGGDFVHW